MKIGLRLNSLVEFIPKSKIVADIGADHGYVSYCLISNNKADSSIITDIKIGPINIAKKNLKKYNIPDDKVVFKLGNGLEPIIFDQFDTVIIAGMGGALITEILEDSIEKAKSLKTLILQPMNSAEILRKWLYNNQFIIIDEKLVCERGKIYTMIRTTFDDSLKTYSLIDCYLSKPLLENKDPLLKKYVMKLMNKYDKIINGLKKSKYMYNKINEYSYILDDLKEIKKKLDYGEFYL